MKNKLSIILKVLGLLLILIALGICIYNVVTDYLAGKYSKEALTELENTLDIPKDDTINSNDYLNNPAEEMPISKVNGKNYIGIISIPSINIELPVLNEYTDKNLNIAPVLLKGSIYKRNAVIIAHNSTSHFKKIQKLKKGDLVSFTDLDGHIFRYEVVNKENISEQTPDLLDEGDWDLSLFTCTSSNIKFRTTVRLKLIN